jgi:superfamily I DNA/RNA helicase
MGLETKEIRQKQIKWEEFNPRHANLDELLDAIQLYEDIESHFKAHFLDKKPELKLGVDSPLRILKHLTDLSKRVPPFVRDASHSWWFS